MEGRARETESSNDGVGHSVGKGKPTTMRDEGGRPGEREKKLYKFGRVGEWRRRERNWIDDKY